MENTPTERVLCEGRLIRVEEEYQQLYQITDNLYQDTKLKLEEWKSYKNLMYQNLSRVREFTFRLVCIIEDPSVDTERKKARIFNTVNVFVDKREEMCKSIQYVRNISSDEDGSKRLRARVSAKWFEKIFNLVGRMVKRELENQ